MFAREIANVTLYKRRVASVTGIEIGFGEGDFQCVSGALVFSICSEGFSDGFNV